MFESLSIGGDPVGFRMIANEFALNAATIQRAGLLQECICLLYTSIRTIWLSRIGPRSALIECSRKQ